MLCVLRSSVQTIMCVPVILLIDTMQFRAVTEAAKSGCALHIVFTEIL